MAITVFDAVGKFSADTSQLDQFIVKLEQGLTSASDKAAASTRSLKEAQEEFRSSIKAVSVEGGATAENMSRLADAEKNLSLAAQAAKVEHSNLKQSLTDAGDQAQKTGGHMMESRHTVMLLGDELGIHIPRAVATMISSIGPLGTLLTAAFPIVAVIALIAAIGKAIEVEEKHQAAVRKSAQEADNLKVKEEDRTAAIEIANLRLEDQIKKLEGRPATNQLAIALREVQSKADELASSFSSDFQKMDQDVDQLNGLIQKFADYTVNALKTVAAPGTEMHENAMRALADRGEETKAVDRVRDAEAALNKARLASHDAATKDAGTQQVALGQQAIAAGQLQKAYDELADKVASVDPNNTELISKLRNAATSAKADWQDLGQEIQGVALTVKQTTDELARDAAKRAEDLDKVKSQGKAQMGQLDAQAIMQAGEQAFAAEQAAIRKLVNADVQGGEDRLQAEIGLIPRMEAAENQLNQTKLTALQDAHQARLTLLDTERADILKYERGDEQQKALEENLNKQNAENKKYELDRQKIAADGETRVQEIRSKGATDQIALEKAIEKANEELIKSYRALRDTEVQLEESKLSERFKAEENAIKELAANHVISKRQERDQLLAIYAEEEADALRILQGQLAKEQQDIAAARAKVEAAEKASKGNPLFNPAELDHLKVMLNQSEQAFLKTQNDITKIQEKFSTQRTALETASIERSIAALTAWRSAQTLADQAALSALDIEIRLAQARGQDTTALVQQRDVLLKQVKAEEEADSVKKQQLILELQLHQARLTAILDEIAVAKAEGQDTSALKAEATQIQHQIQLLQKQVQTLTQVKTAVGSFGKSSHMTWAQFHTDLQDGVSGIQELKAVGIDAFDALSAGMESAIAAAIMGQDSFGAALEKATASALSQIAAQAIVKAIYYTAEGLAALAIPFGAGSASASMYFAAAGEMAAIGAAAAVAGHALAGPSGGSSAGKSAGSSAGGGSSSSAATKSEPNPVQTVNVQSFAGGGVAFSPMPAIIGDSERGGAATEAVLPLENTRALDMIAMALIPPLLRAVIGAQKDKSSVPSFAGGGVAMGPIMAMIGDSESGGAAKEGVFPLENQMVMQMVAEALVPGIVKSLSDHPEVFRAAPAPTPARLLAPSTLASVGTSIQRELTITRAEEHETRSSGMTAKDAQTIASTLAKALDGKTPLSGTIQVQIESDIPHLLKKINHTVSTGRGRLLASNSIRVTKRS